ncbi:AAA family ATPase [Acidobacteria bacterium AH-259-G07]|nr:AAA family ATPase [Acidobacteria bacterium AH-259-G07]
MYLGYLQQHIKFAPNQSGSERKAQCPRHEQHAHGDRNPSCSVNIDKGLLKCFTCALEGNVYQIAKELGWPAPPGSKQSTLHGDLPSQWHGKKITARYQYQNADGSTAFTVCRVEYSDEEGIEQKEFPVWCNGSWGLKDKDVKRVLYRLPKLMEANWLVVVEGEKDVQSLESIGITATTDLGGAGQWRPEYRHFFNPKQKVAILPDNDDAGRRHALQVAQSLAGQVSSIKIVELPGLPEKGDVSDWLETKEPDFAKELALPDQELFKIIKKAPEWEPEPSGPYCWTLHDLAQIPEFEVAPLEWVVESLIPKGGIGFLSGAPKDGKTLLALDLIIHIAHVKPWLERFQTAPVRTLYIAREDPLRRIKERLVEINESYGYTKFPSDAVTFLIRERFNLMNETHITWLTEQVKKNGFQLLILDVLNRMIPELDEISAKDMGRMVSVLEELNREVGLTILNVDHTRKPIGPRSSRDKQEPNPFDLKGSVAKYGAADFMLCLSRTEQDGRLQLYSENKDTDERPHFLIDVSPKDSVEPKFIYAGDIEKLASDRKAVGVANREKVLVALEAVWMTPSEIISRTHLSRPTVGEHLRTLEKTGEAQRQGKGRYTQWRKSITEVVQGTFSDGDVSDDK